MEKRNKKKDLYKLANAFYENLRRDNCEYGGWGIDSKRPFGNSGVELDILEIIDYNIEDDEDSPEYDSIEYDDALKYASDLYDDLGEYLKQNWKKYNQQRILR